MAFINTASARIYRKVTIKTKKGRYNACPINKTNYKNQISIKSQKIGKTQVSIKVKKPTKPSMPPDAQKFEFRHFNLHSCAVDSNFNTRYDADDFHF
jgi:hypothetical protein